MPTRSFEHDVPFTEVPSAGAWLPLLTVVLHTPTGKPVVLPLLFDTGASVTTLRHDLYPLLGLADWNVGQRVAVATAGGAGHVQFFRYDDVDLQVFGKRLRCPVQLGILPHNPLYMGLLGREGLFEHFGFGFWESQHSLLATENP